MVSNPITLLELYAGSRSIGKEAEKLGMKVFSSDINAFDKIDYVTNILDFDVTKVPFIPDIIWASPPCTCFSVASIGYYWNVDNTPKKEEAYIAMQIVEKTLSIIRHFLELNPNLKWFIENPVGKLRKLKVMKGLTRVTITYCSYGDIRMKPTDIWTNHLWDIFKPDGTGWKPLPRCMPNNVRCQHERAPRGSKTGTQGLENAYLRSKLPAKLCQDILLSVIQ